MYRCYTQWYDQGKVIIGVRARINAIAIVRVKVGIKVEVKIGVLHQDYRCGSG